MGMAEAKARTVEVDGIAVTVAIDPNDDYELSVCSMRYNDASRPARERSRALVRMHELVLGDDYERVLGELREMNGGKLPVSAVTSFVNRVIAAEAGDAKN